jgi:beta-glucosidase
MTSWDVGTNAVRFSVSWPRIQPDGSGPADQAGLDHYARVVDELLALGVTPMLTLHHQDLPRPVADRGGWGERDTTARFAEYTELVGARLGDRVQTWITLNEPWCAAFLGRLSGRHALRAAHHLLLAHGLGTQALRTVLPSTAQVSITLGLTTVLPAATSSAATGAVRRVDGLANRLFLDPLFAGHYPVDVRQDTARLTDWSFVLGDDLTVIQSPIDLLCVNYHSPTLVDVGPATDGPSPWPGCENVRFVQPPGPSTAMGWAIDTQGLRSVVHRIHDQYRPMPLMISEDGDTCDDRTRRDHLDVVREAISAGVDLRGYFVYRELAQQDGVG